MPTSVAPGTCSYATGPYPSLSSGNGSSPRVLCPILGPLVQLGLSDPDICCLSQKIINHYFFCSCLATELVID